MNDKALTSGQLAQWIGGHVSSHGTDTMVVIKTPLGEFFPVQVTYEEDLAGAVIIRTGSAIPVPGPPTTGYVVVEEDGGLVVRKADTNELCDWIALPSTGNPGDTDSYVITEERPEAWSPDMRWMVTKGQQVRQTSGLSEGRVGTIVGQARSRKADRIYAANLRAAQEAGRDLTDADFEILIDNEGPLIQFEQDGPVEWFPGQSFGFEPVMGMVPCLGGGSEPVEEVDSDI